MPICVILIKYLQIYSKLERLHNDIPTIVLLSLTLAIPTETLDT